MSAPWRRNTRSGRFLLEMKCEVDGCTSTPVRFEGPWDDVFPRTPSFHAHLRNNLPKGWYFQKRGWLSFGGKVFSTESIYCPEHAPLWIAYVEKVRAWDAKYAEESKGHWLQYLTRFLAPRPFPPMSPFEGEQP